jgi:hypothetical protein
MTAKTAPKPDFAATPDVLEAIEALRAVIRKATKVFPPVPEEMMGTLGAKVDAVERQWKGVTEYLRLREHPPEPTPATRGGLS